MKVPVVPKRGHTIIVGDDGEASLMAAMCHAVDLRSSRDLEAATTTGDSVWVKNIHDASVVAKSIPAARVLADSGQIDEQARIVDALGRMVPVSPIRDELESRFGRVYPAVGDSIEQFASTMPAPSPLASVVRRVVESLVCVLAFVLAAPVVLLISIGCRVFFGRTTFLQKRLVVGRSGRVLELHEFSPIPVDVLGESRRALAAASLRRNIYRTHLNGVPVLPEVLAGRLALVGPMPVSPESFDRAVKDRPVVAARTLVAPGIVSLARVRLRSAKSPYDFDRALDYDLYYLKHRSLVLDARIVVRALLILVSDIVRTTIRILGTGIALMVGAMQRLWTDRSSAAAALVSPTMPTRDDGSAVTMTPVLLVGAGAGARLLVGELQSNPRLGLWPIALVDDDPRLAGTKIKGVPILGPTRVAPVIVERERIGAIIIAVPSATSAQMSRLVQIAQDTNVPVYTMPAIGQIVKGTSPTALESVPVSDLLGRPVVTIDATRAKQSLGGKRVLITGAVGSIGKEVVIQSLRGEPAVIYGLDINESDLYDLQQELERRATPTEFVPVVGSVCDDALIDRLLTRARPHVVFHAAAYKHVPLMEAYPQEAVRTNVGGTWTVAKAAARNGVERFVLVSTDKAVNPTSVMGASKRIAELLVQEVGRTSKLSTCSVRFGNVLGSRGSVIPLFEQQIAHGGPVTITDPGMLRYFMTIPEASGLIIEAGAFGDRGVVYMLDMGEPVRIVDLANRLIELKGLRPGVDIEIRYTGLRPGEKLFEELSLEFENARPTSHPKIRVLEERDVKRDLSVDRMLGDLLKAVDQGNADEIRRTLLEQVRIADGQIVPTTMVA